MAGHASWYTRRKPALAFAAAAVAVIAAADWAVDLNVSLGFLYVIPILIASCFLQRWQIVLLGTACMVLIHAFGPFRFEIAEWLRLAMITSSFVASGLFMSEFSRNRRLVAEHVTVLEAQMNLRQEAEREMRVLIETSPAAIVTVDSAGSVLLANESAHELLGFEAGALRGRPIGGFIPALLTIPTLSGAARQLRSSLECRGQTRTGEAFLAQVWFSTYETSSGPRLAAIITDVSDDLRDREGAGFYSLMATSRILVGAVSHSVRNLCAAASVAHTNLARIPELAGNEDFHALGTLVAGLEKIASTQLERASERGPEAADLRAVLDELRIVIEPSFKDAGIRLCWNVPEELPLVQGEHHGLLQTLLNLSQNSRRALESAAEKDFSVSAERADGRVVVRVRDSGPGVENPDMLFQPFQQNADGTGIGLYVSRAIVRSFDGNLRYEPQQRGSCFALELPAAEE